MNADGRARGFRREDEIFVLNGMTDSMVYVWWHNFSQSINEYRLLIYRSVVVLRALAPTNCSAHNTENTIHVDNKRKRKPKGKLKKIKRNMHRAQDKEWTQVKQKPQHWKLKRWTTQTPSPIKPGWSYVFAIDKIK